MLLSEVLRSLEGCDTLDGVFVEPFGCAKLKEPQWPYDHAKKELINPSEDQYLSVEMLKEISKPKLHSSRLNEGKR